MESVSPYLAAQPSPGNNPGGVGQMHVRAQQFMQQTLVICCQKKAFANSCFHLAAHACLNRDPNGADEGSKSASVPYSPLRIAVKGSAKLHENWQG